VQLDVTATGYKAAYMFQKAEVRPFPPQGWICRVCMGRVGAHGGAWPFVHAGRALAWVRWRGCAGAWGSWTV
jgi:hypothetical protein